MGFTRNARWVLDGHKLRPAEESTYVGVVSRESVSIALAYAALNGLEVFAADIRNAYLHAPFSCMDYIICGPEFGLWRMNARWPYSTGPSMLESLLEETSGIT
jgi:hypothetical protein